MNTNSWKVGDRVLLRATIVRVDVGSTILPVQVAIDGDSDRHPLEVGALAYMVREGKEPTNDALAEAWDAGLEHAFEICASDEAKVATAEALNPYRKVKS